MDHLLFNCEWKAVADGPGELDGYMSVFNNVDQGGDVVLPGAFKKTFADWSRAKSPMPLIADHNLSTDGVIGSVVQMAEDSHGARVRARFSSVAKAQEVRQKMLEGHLSGMSFTYQPVRFHFGQKDGHDVRFLDELKAFEATVTPFPMNQLALASAKVSAYASARKPYGDVSYADPGFLDGDGNQASESGNTPVARYPIDTEAHCRAAWSYFNQGNNSAGYTSAQRITVEGRITAAMRSFGMDVSMNSMNFEVLESVLISALAIPDLSIRKTVIDSVWPRYQPATLDDGDTAAGATDGSPTATEAAGTEEVADTSDAPGSYALGFVHYSEPRDGALNNPLAVLETARSTAELDRLEAEITDALGGNHP